MIRPTCNSLRQLYFSSTRLLSSVGPSYVGTKTSVAVKKSVTENLPKDEKPKENKTPIRCEFFPVDSLDESEFPLDEAMANIREWNSLIQEKLNQLDRIP